MKPFFTFCLCLSLVFKMLATDIVYTITNIASVENGRKQVEIQFINNSSTDVRLLIIVGQLLIVDDDDSTQFQELSAYCLPLNNKPQYFDSVGQYPENNKKAYFFTIPSAKRTKFPVIFTCKNPGLKMPDIGQKVLLVGGGLVDDDIYKNVCAYTEDDVHKELIKDNNERSIKNCYAVVPFLNYGEKSQNIIQGEKIYRDVFVQKLKEEVYPSQTVDFVRNLIKLNKFKIGDDGTMIPKEEILIFPYAMEFKIKIHNLTTEVEKKEQNNEVFHIRFEIKIESK